MSNTVCLLAQQSIVIFFKYSFNLMDEMIDDCTDWTGNKVSLHLMRMRCKEISRCVEFHGA